MRQHLPDHDDRRAPDARRADAVRQLAERAPQHYLVRPARPGDHGGRAVGPVVRQQRFGHPLDILHRQMQDQGAAQRPEAGQILAVGHRGRARRGPGQQHGLPHAGQGQLLPQCRCGRCERRDAGNDLPRHPRRVQAARLLGDRAEDRRVAAVQPRHVLPGAVGADELAGDGVEVQPRGVDQERVRPGAGQDLGRHQAAGVEHHGRGGEYALGAHGQQIRGTGPGAHEPHGHDRITCHCVTGSAGRQVVNPPSGPA